MPTAYGTLTHAQRGSRVASYSAAARACVRGPPAREARRAHPRRTQAGGASKIERIGSLAKNGYQKLDHNDFDMPYHIETGTGTPNTTDLEYTASGQRVRQVDGTSFTSTVKTFIGDLYEQTSLTSSPLEHRYKVLVGSRQVAEVVRSGGNESTYYLHDDHLGSTTLVTHQDGGVREMRSYDPFGAMTSQGATTGVLASYTGHNDDVGLGLVNARGRLYDAKIGRFVTADPYTTNPGSSQGWNRYAYVANNPLKFVDPSGFRPVCTPYGRVCAPDGSGCMDFEECHEEPDNPPQIMPMNVPTTQTPQIPHGPQPNPAPPAVGTISLPCERPGAPNPTASGGGSPGCQPTGGGGPSNSPSATDRPINEELVRANGYGQAALAAGNIITSKEGLARVADFAAQVSTNPSAFVNLLGLSLSNTGTARPGVVIKSTLIPGFSQSGFAPQFQESPPGNQVRHFAGALVTGAAFGSFGGALRNTGREVTTLGSGGTLADIRLGNAAAALGADIISGDVHPTQVGCIIRSEF